MDVLDSVYTWATSRSPRELLVAVCALICAVYCAGTVVYRLLFSPLRHIPGPWYTAVSELWLTYNTMLLRRCRAIHELQEKYGAIVRVAPNLVIFNDSATSKMVYGANLKLNKNKSYKAFVTNDNDQAMTILPHAEHAIRRKSYASHYIAANLSLFQPEIKGFLRELIDIVHVIASQSNDPVDTLFLFEHLLVDVNCAHMFGYKTGSLPAFANHVLEGVPFQPLSTAINDFPKRGILVGLLPPSLWNVLTRIPNYRWRRFCDSSNFVGRFVEERLEDARRSNNDGQKITLIDRLIKYKENMSDKDIVSECVGHIIAGSDTTATTLSFICWELSRRPDMLIRLRAELDACMPDAREVPDLSVLQSLPYLSAVIKEGLRIYTAGPSPLERDVPDNMNPPLNILGYDIPAGTVIASQSWSTHRRKDVFFSPELFLPDRWLMGEFEIRMEAKATRAASGAAASTSMAVPASASKEKEGLGIPSSATSNGNPNAHRVSSPNLSDSEKGLTGRPANSTATTSSSSTSPPSQASQMSAYMFPFGFGPRVCGGQNLAQMMLRMTLAAVVRNFDIVAPPETNEKSMEIKDSFVIFPAGMECKLAFVPRSE